MLRFLVLGALASTPVLVATRRLDKRKGQELLEGLPQEGPLVPLRGNARQEAALEVNGPLRKRSRTEDAAVLGTEDVQKALVSDAEPLLFVEAAAAGQSGADEREVIRQDASEKLWKIVPRVRNNLGAHNAKLAKREYADEASILGYWQTEDAIRFEVKRHNGELSLNMQHPRGWLTGVLRRDPDDGSWMAADIIYSVVPDTGEARQITFRFRHSANKGTLWFKPRRHWDPSDQLAAEKEEVTFGVDGNVGGCPTGYSGIFMAWDCKQAAQNLGWTFWPHGSGFSDIAGCIFYKNTNVVTYNNHFDSPGPRQPSAARPLCRLEASTPKQEIWVLFKGGFFCANDGPDKTEDPHIASPSAERCGIEARRSVPGCHYLQYDAGRQVCYLKKMQRKCTPFYNKQARPDVNTYVKGTITKEEVLSKPPRVTIMVEIHYDVPDIDAKQIPDDMKRMRRDDKRILTHQVHQCKDSFSKNGHCGDEMEIRPGARDEDCANNICMASQCCQAAFPSFSGDGEALDDQDLLPDA